METTTHSKLYIDNRGAFILASHAGHYFLGYDAGIIDYARRLIS